MDSELAPLRALHVAPLDGVSKYVQLRNALAGLITDGRWMPGQRLPTEDELVKATGMSLGTVQRAMRLLVDDRLVIRRQGSGTFVASSEHPMNAPLLHCRFLDDATGETLPIFSHVVRRRPVGSRGPWSIPFPHGGLVCIERLFSINNEFVVYTHLYFERERFPALASEISIEALTGVNFKDLISRDFHLPLHRFSEMLAVRVFPDAICRAVNVPPKTAGAVLEITASDQRGEAVYFQDLYVPPNRRRLVVTP